MPTRWVTGKRRLFLIASFAAYASMVSNSSAQAQRPVPDRIIELKSAPRIYGNSEKGDASIRPAPPAASRKSINPGHASKAVTGSGKQMKETAQEQRAQLRNELVGAEIEDVRRREFLASTDDARRQAREQARKIADEIKEGAVNSRRRE